VGKFREKLKERWLAFNGRLIFSYTPDVESTNRKPASTPDTNHDELSGSQNINTTPLSGDCVYKWTRRDFVTLRERID